MSIYKVANSFIKKLKTANNKTYQDLAAAYKFALSLQQLSDADPYEDEKITTLAATIAKSLGHLLYKADKDPAGLKASDITYALTAAQNRIFELETMSLGADVRAQANNLRSALAKVQPMDIPPRGAAYSVPREITLEDTVIGPGGETGGADETALSNVVQDLAPKPNPWDEEAQKPWEVP